MTYLSNVIRLAALVCLILFRLAFASEPTTHFHIEAGDATLTLQLFSRQADIQVLYEYTVFHGVQTAPVDGEMTWQDALYVMLQDQHYHWDLVNPRILALVNSVLPEPEPPADPSQWLRRFEEVAQVWAEGAGPRPARLIVERYGAGERL